MTSPSPSPDDLQELGLDPTQAAVLAFVLEAQEVTATQIAAATHLSPPRASTAVSSLMRLGLLDRVVARRPSVVFVHHRAEAAVEQLRATAARRRDESTARAERGAEALLSGVRSAAQRGRPMYEIRPGTNVLSPDYDVLRYGRTSHDEVVRASITPLDRWCPSPHCRTRLLLVADTEDEPALEHLRARLLRSPRRAGLTVRRTSDPRADLLVLDEDRVRVTAGSDQGRVTAWSREPSHVRAATDLFELWWREATPCLDVSAQSRGDIPEPEYDVEEWDPDDLGPERHDAEGRW